MMQEIKDVFFYVKNLQGTQTGGAYFYAPNVKTIVSTANGTLLLTSKRHFALDGQVDLRQAFDQLRHSGVSASPFLLFSVAGGALPVPPLSSKVPAIASGEAVVAPESIISITQQQSGTVLETDSACLQLGYDHLSQCRDVLVHAGYRIISLNPL